MKKVLFSLLISSCIFFSPASAAEESYLYKVQELLEQTRGVLPAMIVSAEKAAAAHIAGGKIWAAGRQEDFISEACGRAGGLMSLQSLGQTVPDAQDIVLYAAPGGLNPQDSNTIADWQQSGTQVIVFSSDKGIYKNICPLDTLANVIHLWTWTAEFVSACTRQGKMPILYQSYGLPGGPERGKKYQGKKFHEELTIEPVAPGILANAYLSKIETILNELQTQKTKLTLAAQWWRETPSNSTLAFVIGHMFPHHFQDIRSKQFCDFRTAPAWEDPNLIDETHPPQMILYIGYQYAPKNLINQAKKLNVKLVYTDAEPAIPSEPTTHILYLAPGWPLSDGCVSVPGYDIAILPASGIAQAAIYWEILSEREK